MSKGPFKLRSGNNSPLEFKMMGSSPAKDDPHTTTDPPHPPPVEESEIDIIPSMKEQHEEWYKEVGEEKIHQLLKEKEKEEETDE